MENLRKRFIVDENLEEKKTASYIERLLPFCKVTENGEILLDKKTLTRLEKVKIALVARFLANKLDPKFPSGLTHEELSQSLNIPRDQIRARLKDIKDDNFGFDSKDGSYRVRPMAIGKFLDELEQKYGGVEK